MKRQSKAEEAARAQIKIIQGAIDECDHQIMIIQTRRNTLWDLRCQFDKNVAAMERARREMSTRNKPNE